MCCVDDTEASTVAGVGSSTFSVGFACASRSVISEANVDGYMKQGTSCVRNGKAAPASNKSVDS